MLLDDVRAMHSIESIVDMRGKKWGVCPLPQHKHKRNTPSFSVFWWRGRQYWKCHGNCGLHGDVIDLVGYMQVPGYSRDDWDHKLSAIMIIMGGEYEVSPPEEPEPLPPLAPWIANEMYPPSDKAKKYLYERGVAVWQVPWHVLGSATSIEDGQVIKTDDDNLVSFPTFHRGELIGIKLRKMKGGKSYRYFSYPGSRSGLFLHNYVYLEKLPAFIVKGEIAALVMESFMYQHSIEANVCAPTGGEGADVRDMQVALSMSKNIVIGDNDKDPKVRDKMNKQAEKRAAVFGAQLVFPPEKYKDIDEFILDAPTEAEEMIRRWLDGI